MKNFMTTMIILSLSIELFANEPQPAKFTKEPGRIPRYFYELFLGTGMGFLFGAVSWRTAQNCHDRWSEKHWEGEEVGFMLVFGGAGFALGNAWGIYLAGNSPQNKGSFPVTLVGSNAGTLGCLLITNDTEKWHTLSPAAVIDTNAGVRTDQTSTYRQAHRKFTVQYQSKSILTGNSDSQPSTEPEFWLFNDDDKFGGCPILIT